MMEIDSMKSNHVHVEFNDHRQQGKPLHDVM